METGQILPPLIKDALECVVPMCEQFSNPSTDLQGKEALLVNLYQLLEAIDAENKWEAGIEKNEDPYFAPQGVEHCMETYVRNHSKQFRLKNLNCTAMYIMVKQYLTKLFSAPGWKKFNGLHPC